MKIIILVILLSLVITPAFALKDNQLPAALYWKYGPIFDCLEGQVRVWPEGFTPLTEVEQQKVLDDYRAFLLLPKPKSPRQKKLDALMVDPNVPQSVKDVIQEITK